jgi:hypothetical protein
VPLRIEEREVNRLRGKELVLVKVIWGGPTGESIICKLESRMKESYLELFPSGNFQRRKFFMWGRVATPRFLLLVY